MAQVVGSNSSEALHQKWKEEAAEYTETYKREVEALIPRASRHLIGIGTILMPRLQAFWVNWAQQSNAQITDATTKQQLAFRGQGKDGQHISVRFITQFCIVSEFLGNQQRANLAIGMLSANAKPPESQITSDDQPTTVIVKSLSNFRLETMAIQCVAMEVFLNKRIPGPLMNLIFGYNPEIGHCDYHCPRQRLNEHLKWVDVEAPTESEEPASK
jgi:hypothetical protein